MSSPSEKLSGKDERSRNAKAQARHRAKRKAYVEQLEATVARLQTALGTPSEELDTSAQPATTRIRDLEAQIAILLDENKELRRRLEQYESHSHQAFHPTRTSSHIVATEYDRRDFPVYPTPPSTGQSGQQTLMYQMPPTDDTRANPTSQPSVSLPPNFPPTQHMLPQTTSYPYGGSPTYSTPEVPAPQPLVPPSRLSPISPTTTNSPTNLPGMYRTTPFLKQEEEEHRVEYPPASSTHYVYNSYDNGQSWSPYSHERRT